MSRNVGYLWDTLYGWMDTGSGGFVPADPAAGLQPIGRHLAHPDTKRRFHEVVQTSALRDQLTNLQAQPASEEDLLRVHTAEHIEYIKDQSSQPKGGDAGDGASPLGKGGYEIGLLAAGGAIQATKSVLTGEVDTAYALINPPGHHAERERGMGFCLFNNASVAAAYAKEHHGLTRVAVVDWDVHHGNGTQQIWWDNPDVLTISLHQNKCFPANSGFREDNGGPDALGTALNIPLPPGSGNAVYNLAFEEVVLPALEAFQPELIIVASGFDASAMDPLARQMVTQDGFKQMTEMIVSAADSICDGKLVFVQEGGYSPYYLPICGLGVLEVLTQTESGFGDPFNTLLSTQGVDDLFDHQREEVNEAAKLIANIPAK
ncbi:class II histone deacetylase [Corynebacterium ammoniagenes]|uniref:Acetylpolyamine aminohydrolase n=2 Tax=Corynebacterium ammoniagenes TaxID=1697 RepID=A0AAV5GD19_CORAM|nr:class II histone deacetylase [Corynebacterium ammoniagenes]APT83624.1 acetoin utilization protein [Corynebacterium ammoniagenes DSM 20306]AQS74612.1 class II histone deacetylase [Corynebacterium ammoniagenes]EFG81621.1 histone deacetylase-like amidohydrolase [Corynebacterium ammoniagenes DSM 20306]NMF33037.1 class II histone deacetylase [Corynebacterium ammoniagenes]GJN43456.1 acetylpolyamine aminohydrolase [Corynebacterium ammoniagenes]